MHNGYKPVFEYSPKVANGELSEVEAFNTVLEIYAKKQNLDINNPVEKVAAILHSQLRKTFTPEKIIEFLDYEKKEGSLEPVDFRDEWI